MTVTIEVKKLTTLLKIAEKLTKKSSIPILEHLYINNGSGWATNLSNWMQIVDMFPTNENTVVNIKQFITLLSGIKQKEVNIEIKGRVLYVITEKNTFNINPEFNNDEFPVNVTKMPITPVHVFLHKDDIKQLVTASLFVGKDAFREQLHNVLLGREIVATDAQRLFWEKSNIQYTDSIGYYDWNGKFNNYLLIQKQTIDILKNYDVVRMTCDIAQKSVETEAMEHILFEFEEFNYYQKIIDNIYPDYRAVIPEKFECQFLIHRDQILHSIEEARYIWSKSEKKYIEIFCLNERVKITFSDTDNNLEHNSYIDLYAKNSDIAFNISFNAALLESCLELQDEPITLKYISPTHCMVINDNMLIMPMLKY